MKSILSILFCLFSVFAVAQSDTLAINNTRFVMERKTLWREGSRDTVVKLYRLDSLGRSKYLLTHTIFQFSGDCNNIFEDKGSYQIEGDKIIFHTVYWQRGNDPIPTNRKQIYLVKSDGRLIEIYDKQLVPWADGWVNTNE